MSAEDCEDTPSTIQELLQITIRQCPVLGIFRKLWRMKGDMPG